MELKWSNVQPNEIGLYVLKEKGLAGFRIANIHTGYYPRAAFLDNRLYADNRLLKAITGMWFGPLPECKEEYFTERV